uniref:T-cell surface glycoprotein CD3 gamma/delta n=1 Tax=Lutjanus peru TaxID=290247 RepID=A0A291L8P7_LUTPE|nr:T-cell surface glycoprotein CD3 gamma/delta [Lutjanus peru]
MKCLTVLPACLLLLWTLTASVSCQTTAQPLTRPVIVAKTVSDGIELSCLENKYRIQAKNGSIHDSLKLEYKDDNTGEYACVKIEEDEVEAIEKIYVKFRTCDNCVELDVPSIVGLVMGNVVATTVIGVAVYLIASQTRNGPVTSHKSSDRQRLVQNEVTNRPTNEHYQVLKPKAQRDTYDVLTNRR